MPHSNPSTPKNLPTFPLSLSLYFFISLFLSNPSLSYLSALSLAMAEAIISLSPFVVSHVHVLVLVLLPILCCGANGVHYFEEKEVLSLQQIQWEQQSRSSSITSCLPQKSRREKGSTILEMKHKDYCSSNLIRNRDERQQKHLILDHLHVQSLQSRIKSTISGNSIEDVSKAEIPITSGVKLQTLNYIVKIELGNRKMTVIVDTGSDLTWVQCQPCKLCYNQLEPLFNPSVSPSYQSILCNSTTCQSLQSATGNSGVCGGDPPTSCNYGVSYGDGSYTRGVLGYEKLNLGETTVVNDFVFGCGRNNKGLFGGVSGLMGLGRSDLSLISQTSNIFGGVFSYCLPSTGAEASGSLILGNDSSVYKNTTPISYTDMVSNPQISTFYFLNLTGISIGGVALLADDPGKFNAKNGVLIDSGTVITRLAPSIYNAVKTEFLKQCSEFPTAPPFSILDTCFNLSGYQEVNVPTLKMHFAGDAELVVDVTGVFYFVKTDASQVCLAVASLSYEDDIMIIGNYQQKNTRVVYDTKGSKLGFAEETCSFG